MRLSILERGDRLLPRVLFSVLRRAIGGVPGPFLVMAYKKALFGEQFSALLQRAMREAKHWEVWELEVFAAVVSKTNDCRF